MTLSSPSSVTTSILLSWVHSLRRRFWKEGYGDSARLPGTGEKQKKSSSSSSSKGGSKDEIRGRAAKVLGLLEVATEWGCEEAWGTRGRIALVNLRF